MNNYFDPVKIIGKSLQGRQKSLFRVTNVSLYFLCISPYACPEHTIPLKTTIDRSFRHCR